MKVFNAENKPIKMWLDDVEDSAMDQARNLANLPFIHRHVALMPDCHMGYGMPIGGVIATKGVVIPNAVGVDIGCGMVAMRTNMFHVTRPSIEKILSGIRERVPVGFNHHTDPCGDSEMPNLKKYARHLGWADLPIVYEQYKSARHQLGTLGGGNHFIEIQCDDVGAMWVMIHSGSRNMGLKVAKHYNNLAKRVNARYFSSVPKEYDLAFLPLDTEIANLYIGEMNYCLEFARLNRLKMMKAVHAAIYDVKPGFLMDDEINIHHNYAAMENHGDNVMVHRKGATRARKGEMGIIPGSQGTKSYIVRGLGNKESFESCSHGAGRKMGRKAAIRDLNFQEEVARLDKQGIVHSVRTEKELDEAPGAYKDIETVMENQKDLVEIVTELTPLAVIKG